MESFTEEELRVIADSQELEGKEYNYFFTYNFTKTPDYVGKVLFDYVQGFSMINVNNPADCLIGINGKEHKNGYNFIGGKKEYHKYITLIIIMLRTGSFYTSYYLEKCNINKGNYIPTCPF